MHILEDETNLKIIMFTRSFHKVLGGMEKQIGSISQILTSLGHEVHLVSLDTETPEPFFRNSNFKSVTTISDVNPNQSTRFNERYYRQKRLYSHLKQLKPDLGIAFMTGSFFYSRVPTFLSGVPLILAERNSPQIYRLTSARNFRWIYFAAMAFASKIVVQFDRYRTGYPKFLNNKISNIPNEIVNTNIPNNFKNNRKSFYYAGRLSFQKQIDRLVLGFIRFHKEYPETKLQIIGEGEEKLKLEKIISEHHADSFIVIRPPIENLSELKVKFDVLCLLSIWEGFPNVLAESLASGIPAIGFSNADGVSDLIDDGTTGWLVFDDGSIESVYELLKRTQLEGDEVSSANCIESVQKFNFKSVSALWDQLIRSYEA